MSIVSKAESNPKGDFKRVGKGILFLWLIGTILIIIWPYDLIGWPEIGVALDYWGYCSMVCWGFLLGWFFGWAHFIWEPKE